MQRKSLKLTRDAFLYSEPKSKEHEINYAQCSSCIHFIPMSNLCELLSSKDRIGPQWSCNLYTEGPVHSDVVMPIEAFTRQEVGLVNAEVRCINCINSKQEPNHLCCEFYEDLNTRLSDTFKLNTKISEHACCTGFKSKP